MMEKERGSNLTCFLLGLGLGAVGSLLLAPKMGKEIREGIAGAALIFGSKLGKELREEISEVSKHGYQTAHEIADELAEAGREIASMFVGEAKKTIAKSAEQLLGAVDEARGAVDKSVERISEAVEVGKQTYMEEKYGRKMQS